MKTELDKIKKDIAWLIGQIKCFMSIFPAATTWSNKHSAITGNKYLKDTLVWDNGFIYKCLVDNNSNPTANSFYWEKVGKGWLLQQEQADWNATGGPSYIRNKPTSLGGGSESDPIFQAWLDTNPLQDFITEETDPIFVAWLDTDPLGDFLTSETDPVFSSWLASEPLSPYYLATNPVGYITGSALSPYLTIIDAAATYQPLGSYLTSINGLNISLLNNDSGYLTATALTPYITASAAALTYYPIPAGTISEYIRGDGTIATFPTIPGGLPTGGSAGQILTKVDGTDYNATWQENYADWTSVVKHTVKNDGTALITKGTAVYVTGSNGTNILVGKASNTSEATSSKTMGLMQSNITTTGGTTTGFVITEGLLSGLNTAGQTAGDPVWLGVNGALIYGLANKPYAPAHLVFIGIVTKVSAGSGEIFVKVQNGFELKEIHDVDLITTTPINGHILGFDGTLWVNKTVTGWLGFTPYNATNPSGFTSNIGTVTSVAALTLGTTGTDLSSSVANPTTTPVITLNVPTASATNRGVLNSTDWSTFNNKQNNLKTFNRTQGIYYFEDFISNQGGSVSASYGQTITLSSGNGTARTVATTNRTNQQGIIQHSTGTAATNFAGYNIGGSSLYIGSGTISIETYVTVETLSTASERFFTYFGYALPSNWQNSGNTIFFSYDEGGVIYFAGTPTPNWKCYTRSGATVTLTTTTIPVVASQWYKLRIDINGAATSVTFYIDGNLVATHSTNIPASTTGMSIISLINKTVGTTARTMLTDYFMYEEIFTNPR